MSTLFRHALGPVIYWGLRKSVLMQIGSALGVTILFAGTLGVVTIGLTVALGERFGLPSSLMLILLVSFCALCLYVADKIFLRALRVEGMLGRGEEPDQISPADFGFTAAKRRHPKRA